MPTNEETTFCPAPPGRPLCWKVRDDGIKAGEDWPRCVNPDRCIEAARCFWRAWHQLPADKYRASPVERNQQDLFETRENTS